MRRGEARRDRDTKRERERERRTRREIESGDAAALLLLLKGDIRRQSRRQTHKANQQPRLQNVQSSPRHSHHLVCRVGWAVFYKLGRTQVVVALAKRPALAGRVWVPVGDDMSVPVRARPEGRSRAGTPDSDSLTHLSGRPRLSCHATTALTVTKVVSLMLTDLNDDLLPIVYACTS